MRRALLLSMAFGPGLLAGCAADLPEDGSDDDPERRYKLQNYNAYELEWGLAASDRVSLVTRIHHRSGIFGLVAPPHVGSNFLAIGLRYRL